MVEIQNYTKRLGFLLIFFLGFAVILVLKLFQLQVIQHHYYVDKALANQQGYTELEPRRGEIFVQDYHAESFTRVATNTTLDTVFADPSLIEDPEFLADKLAPILFDEELALREEEQRLKEQRKTLHADLTEEEIEEILKPRSLDDLRLEYRQEIKQKMGQQVRPEILLYQNPSDSIREKVRALNLAGIEIRDKDIIVYPPKVTDPVEYADQLAPIVEIPLRRLLTICEGKNRYAVLATKVEPDTSEKIRDLMKEDKEAYRGIGFEDKSYRFYPEGKLLAQVLGFVDTKGGQYGIEAYYDDVLAGVRGIFKAKLDGMGNQITVGDDTVIEPAQDGADVYLTIDRSIQMESERLLAKYVESTRADAGQIIVMDPKTGEVMAMAQYPTYDPNKFWEALDTEEFFFDEDPEKEAEQRQKIETYTYGDVQETYLVEDEKMDLKLQLLPVKSEETGEVYYEKFKNNVGSAVYRNRVVQDLFEPGSIFKPITMSIAIDDQLVTPKTTINDVGPIKVDEFTIDNALGKHYGTITMTQVLETSNNIGMSWIAQQLGKNLFYSYMKKYGLGKRTDIQLNSEHAGRVEPFTGWTASELATHAFGQGFSLTPIQMVTAFSTLANGGLLMQPTIVKKIEYTDGKVEEVEPTVVRRVVSKKTADTLTAMLESVVERGQSKNARISGYTIAGKTGTAQTYKNGRPLEGPGTTIASFMGYAPANEPRFVILAKLDKPRSSQWADATALPMFRELATYLLQYLNVPPDKI